MASNRQIIKGLKEAQAKAEQVIRDLYGAPMLNAMRDVTMRLEGKAKKNLVAWQSPSVGGVDTGRLRASITPEVRAHGETVVGVVGSNVEYAPNVEFDQPPHWPPMDSISGWARRHGASAFLVARAIARRGTKGKHYFQKALQQSVDYIIVHISNAVGLITR